MNARHRARNCLWLALAWVGAAQAATAQSVFITEFKAVNSGAVLDEFHSASDWIELYNAGDSDLDLGGWFLTDRRADLIQWSFPSTHLPARRFLVVFASGRNLRTPGGELHTSFSLRADGEYLALVRPDGVTIQQEFAPSFPPQQSGFSYGFPMDGTNVLFDRPAYLRESPGGVNPSLSAAPSLALTELMYNPEGPLESSTLEPADFEFIELKNVGTNALNLQGMFFGSGLTFEFPNFLLLPGQYALVVRNAVAFELRYGTGLPVVGEYVGSLADGGERLLLAASDGATIFDFNYDDQWHRITDGRGFSLVPVDERAPAATYERKASWRASGLRDGSPGRADVQSPIPPVFINEVLTRPAAPFEDAIELFNPGTNDVDISGWLLTDDFDVPTKYAMPPGAVVPAGGYLALDAHAFNPPNDDPLAAGFGLGDLGEEIYLFSADANGQLTGFVHGFTYGTAEKNVSWGRHIISTGEEHFVPQREMSFLEANPGPKVGPVVISEIHYHPPNESDEFIELRNLSDAPVPLYDPMFPTNTWRIEDSESAAIFFAFPQEASLPPGGYAIVVNFSPTDAARLEAFGRLNRLAPGTPVFGPWIGDLANDSATLELLRPDPPEAGVVPYIVVDRVGYLDGIPWPLGADGAGASIHRIREEAYGNDPANWGAANPTPGGARPIPPSLLNEPADQTLSVHQTALFHVTALGDGPITYQWRRDGTNIPGAASSLLRLVDLRYSDSGRYSCLVSNPAAAVLSRIAKLTVVDPGLPTLALTSPASPLVRVTSPQFTLAGIAADDVELGAIFIQQENGAFVPADGTENWSHAVNLIPGFNTFRVFARDAFGNVSATNTVVIQLASNTSRLGLLIDGAGAVSGARHGQLLNLGKTYRITAVPRPGYRFAGWVDWVTGTTNLDPALSFVMASNLTFTARFVPGPFLPLAGTYNGLYFSILNRAHDNAGYFSLRVTVLGGYSGRLTRGRSSYALHGRFDDNFSANQIIRRSGSNDLSVALQLAPGSEGINAYVSDGTFGSPARGNRVGFDNPLSVTNFAGHYTGGFTVPGDPSGGLSGSVKISISSSGRLFLRGRLPDRLAVAKEILIGDDGQVPFFLTLYRATGSAFGWLGLQNAEPASIGGPIYWTRTGSRGFTNTIELLGLRQ
jgi:hypothetical protein